MERMLINSVRLGLLGCLAIQVVGCDRLRKGSVSQSENFRVENDCARFQVRANQFANANVDMFFFNEGEDTVTVFPFEFGVVANDFSRKRFRVFIGNNEVSNQEALLVPPKEEFSVFFYTLENKFMVYGNDVFGLNGIRCDLDTISISFP